MVHDFITKILVTICIVITLVSIKKYLFGSIEKSLISLFKENHEKNSFSKVISAFLFYSLILFGSLLILNIWLKSEISWLTDFMKSTTILALSFVAGLFTSGLLGNMIAYLIINRLQEVKVGNRVSIGNVYGDIESIGLFFIHIRNIDNEYVNIPNIVALTKGIKNYSTIKKIIISVTVPLPYVVDLKEAEEIFMEAINKTDGLIRGEDTKPVIWLDSLTEYSAIYKVRIYIENPKKREEVKSYLLKNIIKEIEKRKIKMPLPRRMKFDKGKD
ncbi:MAG: mechanosensitive ion channel family protein [Candidatus Aenigmatarchaeota archaeon]